jgi:hypothetical protein
MSVNFSMIGPSYGYGGPGFEPNWGGNFCGCCQRTLGPRQAGLTGALLGGLVGTLAGGGNPLTGLLGAGIGGLLGSAFGRHNHHHHCHHHNNAHSYPPCCDGGFGGQQYGGYGCSPNYGGQYGGGQYGNFGYNQGGFNGMPQYPGGGYNQFGYGGYPGYQQQFPGGCSPWGGNYGQQYGGCGCGGPGQNFNFGNQCPQSCCCPWERPPQGQLEQEGGKGKPIEYHTSGGYTVKVDKTTITITDPQGKNTVETWGDPHENVNGKHVKDWQTKQRTIVLGDGTKITMSAQAHNGVTTGTSIYDGRQNVQIENGSNTISHHSMNPWDTAYREQSQYDGETALFRTNNRTGKATYSNIYTQDSNFDVTRQYQQIASTGGYANPNQVTDHWA